MISRASVRPSFRRLRDTLAVPLLAMAAASPLGGQQPAQTGRIVGRVVDAASGAGISAVQLRVDGAAAGAISGVDGRYSIAGVPPGTVALRVTSIGYAPKIVTGLAVTAGNAVELDVALDTDAVRLRAIEVTAAHERGTVSRALDLQRTATGIVSSVTAEQISRSPDGDAAAAVRRVSGVTVQDGKFVFVRGLGERYTTTSLNGARIPSPEPERKVVPLDLFPSSLLETITTSKTFTPDQPGDFSGAQVDIRIREFPAQRRASYSASFGYNDAATGRPVLAAPRAGLEWLGFAGRERALPGIVKAHDDFDTPPSQTDVNRMVHAFRNEWSADRRDGSPGGSAAFSIGGNDPFLGQQLGYVVSGTYSLGQEVRIDERRAVALPAPGGETLEGDRFQGATGRSTVLWGGLLNLSTLIDSHSRVALNSTYNRTADNEARFEIGTSENHGGLPLEITRLRYVERSVRSSQLVGHHEFGDRHRIEWSLTSAGVTRVEPDRSEIVYAVEADPATGQPRPAAWFSTSNEGAVRTYGRLAESSLEAALGYRLRLGPTTRPHHVKFGGLYRSTGRTASNRAYGISARRLDAAARALPPEQIFDGRFTTGDQSVFRVTPLSAGGSYIAADRLLAGYGMLELALGSRVRLTGGARVEASVVAVDAEPTVGATFRAEPRYTDLLPAATLDMRLTDRQSLKLSASRTLARPEYRELAGIQYREVLGGDNVIGNPRLRRTRIRNLDLRWEFYPGPLEVISVALFAKAFDDPIERVYLATSGTRIITFLNAEAAENYGGEVELRKQLGSLGELFESFTVFANATLMRSRIRIGSDSAASSKINDERAMVGQAPYVLNAGLSYAPVDRRPGATLLYNVVGKRIVSASEAPLPDVFERPRHVLDLSLRVPISATISGKLDARNLLDAPYEVMQGDIVRERYRAGRTYSVGVSWRP